MASEIDYETLRNELNQVRSDIAVLRSTLKEIAAQQGNAAYETVQRSAKKVQEKAAQSVGAVGHEIGERPFTSMLSTFSVGLLIGMLFGRRI